MGPVSYLIIAVVVGVVGVLVLVSMNRAPRRPDFAMEEFRREMQALAPKRPAGRPGGDGAADDAADGGVAGDGAAVGDGRSVVSRVEPGTPQIKRVGPGAGSEAN